MNPDLHALLVRTSALLYDFDGPLCGVFDGLPAPSIARDLEELAGRPYVTDDPLEVMRQAYRTGETEVAYAVEDALIEAELRAVRSSRAERSGLESIRAGALAGLVIGVVTNNSPEAAAWFLRDEGIDDLVRVIVGREFRRPDLMKPDPWSVHTALRILGVPANRAVLIGDSSTDVEAAQAAGVECVAFANKPGKRAIFEAAGAAIVIEDMGELRDALVELRSRRVR